MAVWRGIGGFRAEASLLTWMTQIAKNHVRQSYRKGHGITTVSLDAMDEEIAVDSIDMVETVQQRRILASIATLPELLKIPLLLALRRGLPYQEIARRLGCTVAAVKMRISRARAILSSAFNQEETRGDSHV